MTENINLDQNFNRSYEVSVWTLQDSFLTVLKWSNIRNKGTLQDPSLTINTDGTQNFSFSIPMSLYIDGKWMDNPIWYNTTNGNLITNMRKIKVIFNKKTADEEVFEFLITQIEMNHASGVPLCTIECTNGLAYHELGKRGYKIELSSELFTEASVEYFKNTQINDDMSDDNEEAFVIDSTRRLEATLDYWCEQLGLIKAQQDTDILDARQWYYRVKMDWSSFSNNGETPRAEDKVYEEEYVSSWNEDGNAIASQVYKEKWRQMDESNSNLYNLTQSLAQTFGIYCRYQYLYDDNYHIIGRLIIFYNNFSNENEGILQFTYPYTTSEITRTIDSNDIVTKMYVDSVEDDSIIGTLSIANTDANRIQEDYLLNFDYLHEVNTITDEQYAAVEQYEKDIRAINLQITPIQEQLSALDRETTDLEAKKVVAENGEALAQKQLDNINDQISALMNADGIKDDHLSYTNTRPDTVIISAMTATYKVNNETRHYYEAKLNTKGIIKNTIKLYDKTPSGILGTATILTSYKVEIKDHEIVGLKYIQLNSADTDAPMMLFLTYDYNPSLYYDNVRQALIVRCNKYKAEYNIYENRLVEIENIQVLLKAQLTTLLDNKTTLIKEFELMMGPALREGHWTPEDYHNYGDTHVKTLTFPKYQIETNLPISSEVSDYISAIWDNQLFSSEQFNYYYYGIEETKIYYPCVRLTDEQYEFIVNQYNNSEEKIVNIVFYDYDAQYDQVENVKYHWRSVAIGSGAQLIFIADQGDPVKARDRCIRPALIITEAESMSAEEINYMKQNSFLAQMNIVENENGEYSYEPSEERYQLIYDLWYTDNELENEIIQVQPRLWIHTLNLKNAGSDIVIKYNNKVLKQYNDYQIITHEDTADELRPIYYYITLKPLAILLNGYNEGSSQFSALRRKLDIQYTISNASTSIYLDAVQVLKENAYPKVSYSLSPNIINKSILKKMYSFLNRIININDNELKLHDAFGYISEITLDLDHPWQDSITVQNYNNKFEDLFSTITAQAEELQRRDYNISETISTITTAGEIKPKILQNTLENNNFLYSFNNDQLILSEEDGLLGTSDEGCITYRNNGVFVANTRDGGGNWIWQPIISPNGINAALIKAGQLDTDKIMIYSGNDVRFQWNSEGLYAYRSINETLQEDDDKLSNDEKASLRQLLTDTDINNLQYVVFNSDGLSLIHKRWNLGNPLPENQYSNLNGLEQSEINEILTNGVKQVEVGWNGLIMRNNRNEKVFYADNEGNLTLLSTIEASSGHIGGWTITETGLSGQYIQFLSYPSQPERSGIRLTGEAAQVAETIDINGSPYYACYNEIESSNVNKTIYYSHINEDHETGANGENVYVYITQHQSVRPKFTRSESTTETIVTSTTVNEQGVTTQETSTITYYRIYIADSLDRYILTSQGEKIEYNNSTDLNSEWYTNLISACDYRNLNLQDYVTYTDAQTRVQQNLKNVNLILFQYIPTFEVTAATGTVLINNGTIGPFTVNENQFSSGLLNNSTLTQCNVTDCYVRINNQNKSLSLYGNAIINISSDSSTGVITFTRMDGTSGNFKIADMQYYKLNISANSQIASLTGAITTSGSNSKLTVTAKSKYGYTSIKEFSLSSVYKAGYDAGYNAGYSAAGSGGSSSASGLTYHYNNRWTHEVRQNGVQIGFESHNVDIVGAYCSICSHVLE